MRWSSPMLTRYFSGSGLFSCSINSTRARQARFGKSIFIAARQRITVQPGFSPKSDGLILQKMFEMRPFHHGREHFFENIISRKKLRRFHPPLQEQGAIEIRSQDSLD